MRLIIYLALLYYPLSIINCQDLKLITRINRFTREEFEVMKSDKKIKNGTYTKEIFNTVSEKGNYKNNDRIGIWEFFKFQSGELEQKYDYDNRKLIFWDITQQKPYNFCYDGKWNIGKLDSIPYLIGGLSGLKLKLYDKIFEYCYQYKEPRVPFAGVTVFSFVVDKDGSTKNHKISLSSKNSIEESLLKIIKDYSNNWTPGIYKGEKVEVEYIISMYMSFKINSGIVEGVYISFDQPINK